jgi:xylulokinase
MAYLSIDIGTSAAKVFAFDEAGRVLAQARVGYRTHRPQPGWAEQEPEEWWQAVVQATRATVSKLDRLKTGVDVIGLTGQMHGPVLLGDDGKPLLPCLIWMDSRAQKESDFLTEVLGRARLLSLTGNLCVPAFPAAKLIWLREESPELYKKVKWMLMPKDYIGFCLTNKVATDPSDASGTLLYDMQSGCWANALVKLVDLLPTALPPIIASTEVLGRVTTTAAHDLHVPQGVPVIIGAGDLATSALGIGVVNAGRIGIILGTAGQLLLCLDRWPEDLLGNFYIFSHAVPKTYLALGTIPTGGAAFLWLARLLMGDEHLIETDMVGVQNLAEKVPPGARGLIFLPYLAGTGTPHMDYQAKGAFIGLTEIHGPGEFVRAVMEGVAYSLRDSLEFLRDHSFQMGDFRVAGGAIRGKLWMQILTDVLRCPLRVTHTVDASPLGAFLLSAVGSGCYKDLVEACEAVVKVANPILPTRYADHYEKGYQTFREFYQALKKVK